MGDSRMPPSEAAPVSLTAQDSVTHARFGVGTVEVNKGRTAIVRFDHGLEECETATLRVRATLFGAIARGEWHAPREVVAKVQGSAIQSVNDAWGVFSRSRIALLPHQLWVCNRVLRRWPIRMMVADDVGLGKTVEAGLILWPLLSRGQVKRLLILCPASLVEQWQSRLREMFDIRLARYVTDADTERGDFWGTHPQVVASLPTLRLDRSGRRERLLEAPTWDLLIVDEAHHLNADQDTGATLGYELAAELLSQSKAESVVFFTGTPHRGKPYGFWALMKLLRPDLFDPRRPEAGQLPALREVLIRNNKQLVTDMQGRKLFQPVTVRSETYSYSEAEDHFYRLLTEFIATGRTYAGSLSAQERRQVMLVLIAMQKLASSSVAAVRRALEGRLKRLQGLREDLRARVGATSQAGAALEVGLRDETALMDGQQDLDKLLAEVTVKLMEDEIAHLQTLVEAARAVRHETKIGKILDVVADRFHDRAVLFFTEYKATQSLLMSALIGRFGPDCVTFINGDDRAEGVTASDGRAVPIVLNRQDAADRFNAGKVRFLVSTEAGGEGIDLQESCHTLVHVDLPWNPMRLHQRVGRLNRYGQRFPVDVVTLRNPETVESRIWEKLNAKIGRIMTALASAMDEPEDLLQLVLGMTSPTLFTELFSEASGVRTDSLSTWFDEKTRTFGGQDAIEAVKALVGHAARFDLAGLKDIPKLDLPDLKPFFSGMLALNKRRPVWEEEALSFKTPDSWLSDAGVRQRYAGLLFRRGVKGREAASKVIGVGHRAFDQALRQAQDLEACVSAIEGVSAPTVVFQLYDQVTAQGGHVRQVTLGVRRQEGTTLEFEAVTDGGLLSELNGLKPRALDQDPGAGASVDEVSQILAGAEAWLASRVGEMDLPFTVPGWRQLAVLWPRSTAS